MSAKIITRNQATVYKDGIPYFFTNDGTREGEALWSKIVSALNVDDYDTAIEVISREHYYMENPDELLSLKSFRYENDGLLIHNGTVTYKGDPVPGFLATKLNSILEASDDKDHIMRFLNNLMENPDSSSIVELFDFLSQNNLPITTDGCFLAYKSVNQHYKDRHTGKIDNSVGAKPAMKRAFVDNVRTNTCSSGFHFCSIEYIKGFYGVGGHLMVVKINPADVVSIPVDYNNAKGRCSTYEVVSEVPEEVTDKLLSLRSTQNDIWNSPVVEDVEEVAEEIEELEDFTELEEHENELLEALAQDNDEVFDQFFDSEVGSETADAFDEFFKENGIDYSVTQELPTLQPAFEVADPVTLTVTDEEPTTPVRRAVRYFLSVQGELVDEHLVDKVLLVIENVQGATLENIRSVVRLAGFEDNSEYAFVTRIAGRMVDKLKAQGVITGTSGEWLLTGLDPQYMS